jgi:hypothetical protein
MKTLSTLGLSTATVHNMSKETLAEHTDNPEEEIPRLKAMRHTNHEAVVEGTEPPELEPMYYTIPRDEFVRIEGRYKAAKELDAQLGYPDNIEVGIRRSSGRGDDLVISVEHQTLKRSDGKIVKPDISLAELEQTLPDTTSGGIKVGDRRYEVENIEVEVEETKLVDDGYYSDRYRPVPGGCMINNNDSTIGHPAYDNDAEEYIWTTAAHCVDRSSGKTIFQPAYSRNAPDGNYIGDSDKYIPQGDGDAATIMPKYDDTVNNVEYRYAEDDGSYTDWVIYGTRSTDYLKDMAAYGESVYKQGITTGRLSGKVLKVSSDEEWVTIDCDRDGGDSGGPYFDVNSSDEAYAVGLHKMGVDYDDDGTRDESKGNTMEFVNNYLNLSL